LGLAFCVIGAGLLASHFFLLFTIGTSFDKLLLGPTFMGLGVTLLVFPGNTEITVGGVRSGMQHPHQIEKGAPALHKAAWIIGTLASTAVGLRLLGVL